MGCPPKASINSFPRGSETNTRVSDNSRGLWQTFSHNIGEESYYDFRFPAGLVRIIPGGDCSRIPVKGNTKVGAG